MKNGGSTNAEYHSEAQSESGQSGSCCSSLEYHPEKGVAFRIAQSFLDSCISGTLTDTLSGNTFLSVDHGLFFLSDIREIVTGIMMEMLNPASMVHAIAHTFIANT